MATPVAISLRREAATQRIIGVAERVAEQHGIEPPQLNGRRRDAASAHANDLTALADWLEMVEPSLIPVKKKKAKGKKKADE